jgi:predicted DNA binding CopG/RHH family protein
LRLNERKSNINLAARMPKFKSEAEEADWWDKHEDIAMEMLRDAWPEMFKKEPTEAISLRLPVTQLAAVREYASHSGQPYQALLKHFIDIGIRSLAEQRAGKFTRRGTHSAKRKTKTAKT